VEEPQPSNILRRGHTVFGSLDLNKAVDIVLLAGQMSFHHANLIHGSKPNSSTGPRIGYAVRYVSTAVKQHKLHIPVILARGRDKYHHYRLQERPTADVEEGVKLQQRALTKS
jgi:hypothetical protein